MARRKMKKTRLITILILSALIVLIIILLWRYNTLLQLQESYQKTMNSSNFTYTAKTNDYELIYWYKDGNAKESITYFETLNKISIYTDFNTEIQYIFNNNSLNSENQTYEFKNFPTTSKAVYSTSELFQLALIPLLDISTIIYDGKICIHVNSPNTEEIIEKSTGLILYSRAEKREEIFYSYSFNTVTDGDVYISNYGLYNSKK